VTFNISRLKPYVSNSAAFATRPQRYDRPPPEAQADTNGDALWQVDRVLACKKVGRGKRYLVAWKGYPPEENTWEPQASISHTSAYEEFQAAQQLASDEQADALSGVGAMLTQLQTTSAESDAARGEAAVEKRGQSGAPPPREPETGHTKPMHRSHQPSRDRRTPQAPLHRISQAALRQDTRTRLREY
jgi:hypothetical protein